MILLMPPFSSVSVGPATGARAVARVKCALTIAALSLLAWPRESRASTYTFSYFDFPRAESTTPMDITDAGRIIGYYNVGDVRHGFDKDGNVVATIDVPGTDRTSALGINNGGQVVGYYYRFNHFHGFIKIGEALADIDVPGASDVFPSG